jgi:hypothetical protein
MFENKVGRRMFAPKRNYLTGCRTLHSEVFHNIHSLNIIVFKKLTRMIGVWNVERVGKSKLISKFCWKT